MRGHSLGHTGIPGEGGGRRPLGTCPAHLLSNAPPVAFTALYVNPKEVKIVEAEGRDRVARGQELGEVGSLFKRYRLALSR